MALYRILCCWLAPAAFLLDRFTKRWAEGVLKTQAIEVWPGVLRLSYVENTGAAFGLLQNRQGLLTVFVIVILLALLLILFILGKRIPPLPTAGLWLLIGGAAGNLADRLLHGYVVDFIEIQLFRFPVFNVADICVCIAFALLAGWILFGKELRSNGG